MRSRRKASQKGWMLLLFGLMAVWGFPSVGTSGELADLPSGLSEVSPAMPVPKFSLPAINGATMDSAALQGKVVVVRFWATW
jgi:cytochrome oxidase Cu insertion factor (SCO1/SenC/PrrC family)